MKVGDLVKMKESPRDNEEWDVGIVVDFKPSPDGFWPGVVVAWTDFGIAWHRVYNLEILHEVGS
tara:strand:- start:442 stop:633 length:192 start_codon:yes stop_codon:yes gene_type:complete